MITKIKDIVSSFKESSLPGLELDMINIEQNGDQNNDLIDFLENGSLGLHRLNSEGIIIWANQAELDLLGYSREEYIGKPIYDFHEDKTGIQDILNRLSKNEILRNYEARLICKSGELKDVLINSSVLFRDGKFIHTRCFTQDITERKIFEREIIETKVREASDKIRDQQALLAETQQIAHVGSWDWDINSNVVKWSDELYRILGYEPQDGNADYLKFIAHIHTDDRNDIQQAIQNCYQTGEPYFFRKRIIKRDKTIAWIESKGKVICDASGFPSRIAGIVIDVTEQKEVDEKLKESQRLLEQITDSTPNMLYVYNLQSKAFVYFNRELENVLGYTPEQIKNSSVSEFLKIVHKEDAEKISQRNIEFIKLKNHEVVETELRIIDSSGKWKIINARETIFKRDFKGKPLEVLGVAEDITLKKKNLEDIRELNEAMQYAVEGIAIIGSNGNLIYVNKSKAKLTGYKPKELIGINWKSLIHPEDNRLADEAFEKLIREQKATVELRGLRKNGSFFYKELTMVANLSKDNVFKGWYSFIRDITERKKAEQLLIDTKLKFEAVFNQTYQFISLLDTEGRVLNSNNEALNYSGTIESIQGKYFADLPAWKDKLKLKSAIDEAAKGGFVRYIMEMSGTEKSTMVDFSVKPILNEQDKIIFLIAEGRDITERIESEKELLKSKTLLAEAEKLAHNGSWEWDIAQNKMIWSDEMYRIYGLDSENDAISFELQMELLHPDETERIEGIIRSSIKTKAPFSYEHRIIQKGGTERILLGRGKVLADDEGNTIKILGSALDITEQKEATRQILINQGLYRTLAKNIPNSAVLFFDKNLVLTLADGAAINALGVSDKMLGLALEEVFKKEDDHLIVTAHKVFEGLESTFEKEIMDRVYTVDILPVKNLNGDIFSGMMVAHDITEVKKYQEELEMHIEELNRSNIELEQFAYVASHDLQEPLRKIRTFGGRLSEKFAENLGDDGQIYISRMQNAAQRMQVLIDDLLAFSRLSKTEESFTPTNLNNIIAEIISDFEITIEQKNAIIKIDNLPVIDAMPTQMRQLFQNLLSNALKFTKPFVTPEIIISAEILQAKDLPLAGKNKRLSKYCKISVKDNGIGFDNKYTDKIFVIFQRLHGRSEYPGTGIGLAVCKKILENHQGFITSSSRPENGSTFNVFLPLKISQIEQML